MVDVNHRLWFTITQKEKEILDHIQSVLGFGQVYYLEDVDCWCYRVQAIPHIFQLACLFNGNFFLEHRIEQLACWIDVLYTKGNHTCDFATKVTISLNDGWLSGFTDAEGCFNVHIFTRTAMVVGFRVILRFILDPNDQAALLTIQQLFGLGKVSKRNETKSCYRLTINSFTRFDPWLHTF